MRQDEGLALIGTWRGWAHDIPAHSRGMGLLDLLAEVKLRKPNYDHGIPVIERLMRQCLKYTSSFELLNFTGTAKELAFVISKFGPEAQYSLELLRSLRVERLFNLLNHGVLGWQAQEAWYQHNKITDNFTTTFSKILRGINGLNETLEVQSIVIGAGYSVPASTQTALDNQIGGAKTPDDSIYTGYQTTFLTSFITSENNGLSTTVSAVTSSSQFDLTSVTGLAIGDRVEINDQKRTVANLSGSTVTLDEALTAAPTIGDVFLQIWGETGLLINGDSVLGTRSRVADGGYAKDNTKAIFVESAITVKIVGQ